MDRNVKHARFLIAAFGIALITTSAFAESRKPAGAAKAGKKTGPVARIHKGNVPTGKGHLVGGPDGFGYFWMDQAEPLLDYSFFDISGTGTNIVSGNEASATATLTEPFTFYGAPVNALNMSTNGYLSTSTTDPGTDNTNDCPLPAVPDFGGGGRMYPLHDDLVTGAGYVEYFADCPRDNTIDIDGGGTTESCTIFQWDDTNHFGSTATFTFDFQTVLYHDSGVIVHQITNDPETGTNSTTGIQQDLATNGIEYACNTAGSVPASTAVAFYACGTIGIAPAALPDGTCETAYSQQLTATGGTAPYTYAVTAGALPPGLNLSAAGLVSGTPTAPGGNFTFTVTATDAKGCTGSQQHTLTINCGPPPEIVADCLPEGTEGSPYSFTLSVNGGAPPYTWSIAAGALPPGITLGATTGTLSGTPTAAGTYTFTVRVTDNVGGSGQLQFVLFIGENFDLLVGSGLGFPNPNQVRVWNINNATPSVDFLAYGSNQWGTNVASGNIANGPGADVTSAEILTGPGPGGVYGPHVRGWFRDGTPIAKVSFFAYGTLRYGVNVASGNIDGQGENWDEIISGAGPGDVFGPHVRGWNYDNTALTAINKVNFFAYGTLRYGVNVDEGDLDADTFCADEMVTGPGPGQIFGAQVRGWNYDGVTLSQIAKINFNAFATNYGVNVSGGDVDADLYAEIATAMGPDVLNPPQFSGFNFDGTSVTPLAGFTLFQPTSFTGTYGARVGLGDVGADGGWDLLAGQGRDPASDSSVCTYTYNGGALTPVVACFQTMPATQFYGVNPAGAKLGY